MPRVDALPSDVFALLARFLTGFDLLRLSHASRRLLTELLAPDAPEWQRRVQQRISPYPDARIQSAKERYCVARSMRFPGRCLVAEQANERRGAVDLDRERGGAVKLWRMVQQYYLRHSFSFDLWFALHESPAGAAPETHVGGIILGAQSNGLTDPRWPFYHQQFVLVDANRDLYCSVLDATKVAVARNLQPQRWYHLALTFAREPRQDQSIQRVYLDGQLVHEATGSLHRESRQLRYGQLGSGCISSTAPGKPTRDFCGWYSFNGVLDGGRLWRDVLSPEHVRRAARGDSSMFSERGYPRLQWEMDPAQEQVLGSASCVQCTRPLERVYMGVV